MKNITTRYMPFRLNCSVSVTTTVQKACYKEETIPPVRCFPCSVVPPLIPHPVLTALQTLIKPFGTDFTRSSTLQKALPNCPGLDTVMFRLGSRNPQGMVPCAKPVYGGYGSSAPFLRSPPRRPLGRHGFRSLCAEPHSSLPLEQARRDGRQSVLGWSTVHSFQTQPKSQCPPPPRACSRQDVDLPRVSGCFGSERRSYLSRSLSQERSVEVVRGARHFVR